ncbi:MAG: ketoacyl-ACP synthase III, partial [Candidatus Aminicenantes bacterium]|nr:ketoacyl-ACP synthase III [Candidatus Aminicenantes bacterium]
MRIAGIASAVPDRAHLPTEFYELFGKEEVLKVVNSTGVHKRHLAPPGMCTSDLCVAAANRLLCEGKWDRQSIDAVIFLSQSPDYFLPFTAALIQRRLGLSTECAAFDVNLGCSGYVYGLWLAGSLIAGGGMRRVLLLMGDNTSHVSEEDKSVALIFGDAGAASILDKTEEPGEFIFVLGTDGRGAKNLIIPAGRCRKPSDATTRLRREDKDGNRRSEEELYMNGAEIFAFTLAEVPKMIRQVLTASEKNIETIDSVILHQANKFILEYLAKRMKIPMEKMPLSLGEYGNTSSASIPVTMTHCLRDQLSRRKMDLLLGGFGIGYSWGAVTCTVGEIVMPEMIFLG